jgi:hypothetical protein
VFFQHGVGKGDALTFAIKYIGAKICYAVRSDVDYTYPAELIPLMIKVLEENPKIGMCAETVCSKLPFKVMNDVFFGNKLVATTHTVLNDVTYMIH